MSNPLAWVAAMGRSSAVHVRRVYEPPDNFQHVIRRYADLVEHDPKFGLDPFREERRRQLGPNVRISKIAVAEGRLPIGAIETDPKRRLWRFRARDPVTDKVVFERYVEGDTPEAAKEEGVNAIKREWRALGLSGTESLIGAVLAV